MNRITPLNGVPNFIKRFGNAKNLINAAASMGLNVTYGQINNWKGMGSVPEHIYNALSSIITEDQTVITQGYIEFYLKGKPLGKFFLARDISAVIRKRR